MHPLTPKRSPLVAQRGKPGQWLAALGLAIEKSGCELRGVQQCLADLNRVYRDNPALWALDSDPAGFEWLNADADLAFAHGRLDLGGKRIATYLYLRMVNLDWPPSTVPRWPDGRGAG